LSAIRAVGGIDMMVAIPSNKPSGLDATISPHFGRCEVFTVVEIKNGKVVGGSTVENRGTHLGFDKTPAEILASNGVDAVLTQGMGPKAMQLFAQNGIAVYMTSAKTVREAVRELVEDKAKLASLEDACKEARESAQAPPPSMFPFGPGMGGGMGMGRGMGRGMGMGRGIGPSPYGFPYSQMASPAQYPQQGMQKPSPPPTGRFKIGVANQGPGELDDMVSPMFGRCPSFTIVEIEGKEIKNVKVLPNQYVSSPSGVGIAVVQMLANEGVKYILAGRFGPNVSAVSGQLGIQMVMVPPGVSIRDAINQFIIGSR
jgi:predicted Fe-Mo cluster-binding NifX family protein